MQRPGVRQSVSLSVCPVDRQQQRRLITTSKLSAGAACKLSIDLLPAPELSSKCGQRHVESRGARLNADLFVRVYECIYYECSMLLFNVVIDNL